MPGRGRPGGNTRGDAMDIRTKLVLALVLVALSSMALLGTFAYQTTAQMLQQISVRQLSALAESRKDDIQNVYEGWQDKVSLVRSRTQLRLNLVRYTNQGDRDAVAGIERILDDALTSVDVFERIALFDHRGVEVARVGESSVDEAFSIPDHDEVEFVGSFPMSDGGVHIVLRSGLYLNDAVIGGVEVVLSTDDLRSVVSDYTGLGETGEVLIVMQEDARWLRVLHPLRHQDIDHKRIELAEASAGVAAALSQRPTSAEDFRFEDYRGEVVWGASRYLDGLGWGLVVKIDEAEEEQLAHELRGSMIDLSLALSAFAVVGGTVLGFWLARPVLRLREIVEQVRAGDVEIRADSTGDDEIAYLAAALNDFLDQYQGNRDNDTVGATAEPPAEDRAQS